jgi:hypothetical protein
MNEEPEQGRRIVLKERNREAQKREGVQSFKKNSTDAAAMADALARSPEFPASSFCLNRAR